MADSKLRDLSTDFAVKAIKICDGIKGHYSLVTQLERSSTSIGANVHEANYAHSVMFLAENLNIQRSASIAFDQSNALWLSPNPYYKQKEQE